MKRKKEPFLNRAYWAGVFDLRAYVALSSLPEVYISFSMSPALLDIMHLEFPEAMRRSKGSCEPDQLVFLNAKTLRLLDIVRPYLRVKTKQVKVLLAFLRRKRADADEEYDEDVVRRQIKRYNKMLATVISETEAVQPRTGKRSQKFAELKQKVSLQEGTSS